MEIGGKIALLRRTKSLTQKELAREANVSLSSLKKIEEGHNSKPSIKILARIADALGLELEELYKK